MFEDKQAGNEAFGTVDVFQVSFSSNCVVIKTLARSRPVTGIAAALLPTFISLEVHNLMLPGHLSYVLLVGRKHRALLKAGGVTWHSASCLGVHLN